MKKTTMRVLSVLLSLLLVMTLAPLSVLAAGTAVAKIGDTEYDSLAAAIAAVQEGETITLVSDDTVNTGFTLTKACVIDLNGCTLNVRVGGVNFNSTEGIVIKNGTINLDGAVATGDAIFGIGLRLSGDENRCKLALEDVNVEGSDYSSAYGVFYIYNGEMAVDGGDWKLSNDLFSAGGVFKSDNGTNKLVIENATMDFHNVRRAVVHTTTTIEKSTVAITGDETVSEKMEHGFNRSALTIVDSTIEMENLSGRGITAENGAVSISGNSNVTLTNCVEATIDVRGDKTVTIEPSADVKLDKAPTFTSGVVSGMVEYPDNSKTYEIGDGKDYATFADAIAQVAIDQLCFVTYKVYGHVTLPDYTDLAPGSVGAVTIEGTGMDSSSITITGSYRVRLVTGSNIPLTVKNISLIDAVTSTDAWENTYFAPDADIFTFENVKFNDGVIVWGGKTASFVGCIFDNTTGKVSSHYTIFIEGESNVTVEKCVFTENCQRGIKVTKSMYPSDATVRPELSVSDSKFEMTTGKPAIVLTYADSVTLKGNTYPVTGVFELDADGAPNGTALDADITDIACTNDLYADCGALMGGKIYTTAADAARDAKSGDVITLFYDVEEAIALPEGVILNPNGYTTAVVEADARIGDTVYGSFVEALEAAKPGEVVVALRNIAGAGFTIDKSITVDFNGFSYIVNSPVAGTDGIVIKSGVNVTLKNGTIANGASDIYALIQNFANLTVEDMTIRGGNAKFALSNNICKVQILGDTS
ncbi:MAG: right-handed parallel beta-helix repeat-containing protein, partial [Clostridia bacterium]|nr:right-handed parallel beta-helix repeat-containing protein [Clostridia bacterium]